MQGPVNRKVAVKPSVASDNVSLTGTGSDLNVSIPSASVANKCVAVSVG